MLRVRARGVRLCIGPNVFGNAFGNALGSSLAAAMRPGSNSAGTGGSASNGSGDGIVSGPGQNDDGGSSEAPGAGGSVSRKAKTPGGYVLDANGNRVQWGSPEERQPTEPTLNIPLYSDSRRPVTATGGGSGYIGRLRPYNSKYYAPGFSVTNGSVRLAVDGSQRIFNEVLNADGSSGGVFDSVGAGLITTGAHAGLPGDAVHPGHDEARLQRPGNIGPGAAELRGPARHVCAPDVRGDARRRVPGTTQSSGALRYRLTSDAVTGGALLPQLLRR